MAQKFSSLEDAAAQLGISKDRLTQLREAGKVRGYRDGASWKFRSDDIDKLVANGIPQLDPSSSGLDLDLAEGDDAASAASDVGLEEIDEPTVAGLDDDALSIDLDESIDLSDSILLSEEELGTTPGRPPSTIIGRNELDLDADLDLETPDKGSKSKKDKKAAAASDKAPGSSDDLELELPSPSGDFAGLEEVEVDLEAESSRILTPEETAKARKAAAVAKAAETSDLELAPTDSDVGRAMSDIGLGKEAASGTGLTGLSALELEDDDEVLGDGSDVTLSGESSGINIISPSDSGLALDEVSLDLTGSSPIGSSLDLGEGDAASGIQLESLSGIGESKIGEDFQLTPLGEEGADDEKDSSQVIALEELSEEMAGTPAAVATSDSGMLSEDFGVGLTPGAVVMADPAGETPFSLWNVLGLASCLLLMSLCGMMIIDLLLNMWSWEHGVTTINSSLLEVLNPFL